MELQDRKVVVTGGAGFLGTPLVRRLEERGARVFVPRKRDFNLIDFGSAARLMMSERPDIVVHMAAFYGGIGINQKYPGRIYYENLVMGAHTMEAARLAGVQKFVTVGTACSYPGYLEGDLNEQDFWSGPLHDSVVNYGMSKKVLAVQGWAYHKQYGFGSIHLVPTNLYGPGDTFHIDRAHVVSALIKKFVEAAMTDAETVEVWGTGKAIREFLYVDDAAEAIVLATERYDELVPLNVGTGRGTSIAELATLIKEVSGFRGKLVWNTDKPDGALRKVLDVTRMKKILGWEPPTALRIGLSRTIEWYRANKEQADQRL